MAYYIPPPMMAPMPRNSSMAVISMISGILSWFLLPILGAIIAVITGHIAKGEIRRGGGLVTGDGMASIGLILGYGQLALAVCGCITVAILLAFGVTVPFVSNIIGR